MDKYARFLLWTAIVVGGIVGLARGFALRWWQIPFDEDEPYLTASLSPTLEGGDWVLLWRATPPGMGDLVACAHPTDEGVTVIGRIAAEDGQRIKIERSDIHLDGNRVVTERACYRSKFKENDPASGVEVEQRCDEEVLGGVTHFRGNVPGSVPTAFSRGETTVAPGHVYLVSDNRQFSQDSRIYGAVPRENCTETISFRLWSKDGFQDADNRFQFIH